MAMSGCMAWSFRSDSRLPFDFPSLVWKFLLGQRPDFKDLQTEQSSLQRQFMPLGPLTPIGRTNS